MTHGPRVLGFVPSMECLHTKQFPEGPDWAYEIKLDGYRAQAIRTKDTLSRNNKDLGARFPPASCFVCCITRRLRGGWRAGGARAEGRPSFSLIQNSENNGAPTSSTLSTCSASTERIKACL
jgi:ATP-dependent DNA ligase